MPKVIGTRPTEFNTSDGTRVKGLTVFTTEPIDPAKGRGESADRFFLSAAKLAKLNFTPTVGMNITLLFNKYGKVQTITEDDDFEIET